MITETIYIDEDVEAFIQEAKLDNAPNLSDMPLEQSREVIEELLPSLDCRADHPMTSLSFICMAGVGW